MKDLLNVAEKFDDVNFEDKVALEAKIAEFNNQNGIVITKGDEVAATPKANGTKLLTVIKNTHATKTVTANLDAIEDKVTKVEVDSNVKVEADLSKNEITIAAANIKFDADAVDVTLESGETAESVRVVKNAAEEVTEIVIIYFSKGVEQELRIDVIK